MSTSTSHTDSTTTPTARVLSSIVTALNARQAAKIARAERARLEAALSEYSTESDRAEMHAMLNRYPESDVHRAWGSVLATAPSDSLAHV